MNAKWLLALPPILLAAAGAIAGIQTTTNHPYHTAIHEYEHCNYMWRGGHTGECHVRYAHPNNTTKKGWSGLASAGHNGFMPNDNYKNHSTQHELIRETVHTQHSDLLQRRIGLGAALGLSVGVNVSLVLWART